MATGGRVVHHLETYGQGMHAARSQHLSAHADADELMVWLRGFSTPPRRTFVVHGEPEASDALRQRIERELRWHVTMPEYRASYPQ